MATAKKPAAKKAAPKVQVETVSYEAEAPVVAKVKEAAPVAPKDTWEIKDVVKVKSAHQAVAYIKKKRKKGAEQEEARRLGLLCS